MRPTRLLDVVSVSMALLATAAPAVAQSWTNLTPGSGTMPAARRLASAILDPVENRVVIFGGFSTTFLNDIWAFDLDTGTWANLTPGAGATPAPRITPGSVYDPVGHRMITWSGQGPGVFFNDVWAFDLTNHTWSPFSPSGGPPAIRYGVGATFDVLAGDLVTFAGFTNQGRFSDVWRFDATGVAWTDVSPGSGPEQRCLHSACYDAQEHRMIMYGGQRFGPLDDIWALDLDTDTWENLTPASRPAGRYHTAFVYDVINHRATVFGGQEASSATDEAWVFDLWTDAWTLLSPSGTPPSARWGAAGIYDQANDRMIVFGGFDSAVRNDVWALENLSGTVTNVPRTPAGLVLHPNTPNPFNPSTTIRFELPVAQSVRLTVFDVTGRRVRSLANRPFPSGAHTLVWDGRDDAGHAVSSGVYLCRLETNQAAMSRKMVLLK